MILRRFCARHGRTALSRSSRPLTRSYAYPSRREPGRNGGPTRRTAVLPNGPLDVLETSAQATTTTTRHLDESINSLTSGTSELSSDINTHAASRIGTLPDESSGSETAEQAPPVQQAEEMSYKGLQDLYTQRRIEEKQSRTGSHMMQTYDPLTLMRSPPKPQDLTLPMLLANQTHLGHHTSLWHPGNSRYIFGIRDSIHIISLEETFAHLRRAAKVVQEVARRGGIILMVGTRKGQDEVVVNAAKLMQGYHILDRWVPGSLTNGQQILGDCPIKVVDMMDQEIPEYTSKLASTDHPVLKPDLVICLNPLENEVCLHECGLHNVPTIGVVDTDVNPTWVTYPIPANDDSLRSIALIAGCLGRAGQEGQRLRLESAQHGVPTYDSEKLVSMLAKIDEVQSMGIIGSDESVSASK